MRSPEIQGYFELEDGDEWAPLRPFPTSVRIDLADRHVRMLDLVGDGGADILVSEDDALAWYRSEGRQGFRERRRTTRSSDEERSRPWCFCRPMRGDPARRHDGRRAQ